MAMEKQQGGSDSNWVGMLKGWIPAHLDATHRRGTYSPPAHSDGTHRPAPKWRGKAQKMFMTYKPPREDYDIDDRVYDISGTISMGQEILAPADIEELLDEIQVYAEEKIIDVASALHQDGCLSGFLTVLYNKHANIRAKGAEVVISMVQSKPTKNQQLLIEGNGLQLLLYNLTSDPDATSRTKALDAISALLRNNKPGITEFRQENGYAALRVALSSESVRLQRDALSLIEYLLHENSSDCNMVTELEFPCIMMHLSFSDDAAVREAALRGLLVLARVEGGNSGQLVKNDDKLKQVLEKLIEGISAKAPEDLGSARKEIQLVDSLWNACYNEPSSLAEKGLLVLPGEDALVPDVASKLFEPPLRALAAAEAADGNSSLGEKGVLVLPGEDAPAPDVASMLFEPLPRAWAAAVEAADGNSVSEKKDCNIVTELGLPRIMMHLASSDDAEVRETALRGLLVLAREDGNSGQLVKNDDKLKQVLEKLIATAPEDLGAAREERQLVESLWNACFNEPLAAAEAADGNSLSEMEYPSSAGTPTYQSNSSSKRRKHNCL